MKTKHSIVREYIMSKILDGTYKPNEKINSESELMKQFNVSRHTVRVAVGDLVNQGWLYREQGAGTFCAERTENERVNTENKNIAIITTYISDYIFPSIIRGGESYLSSKGYHVSLYSTDNDHEKERKLLENIMLQRTAGIIIEPTKSSFTNPNINHYLNLENSNIPYIMINAFYDELEPVSITMDDEKGGYLQTEHLFELGHKNIAGFFKTDDLQGTKRMKGYLSAHRDYNIPIDPDNLITYYTDEKTTKPLIELEKLLSDSDGDRPTAIVCYNDELCISLLNVLRKREIRVPEDMSIIGYDDSFMADVSEVKLTTIKHPLSKMGEEAARMILDLVKSKNRANKTELKSVVYDPKLVIRSSTAPLE